LSEWLLPLAGIALANILGAMSPGPAFVLIARIAVAHGRDAAWPAIAGLALGAVLWAGAAIWGLQAVFATLPWLARALPLAGGVFLIYLAIMIWRAAPAPPPRIDAGGPAPSGFLHAFLLQVSNPKIMIFFGSIFMAILPPQMPLWVELVVLAMALGIEFGWYGIVAGAFGSAAARAVYARAKTWIDRAMAALLAVLGLRLLAAQIAP
jgi:threonine/homoserine/homoserine lactone efflux protein